ncbi:uncharacterized protein LOC124643051 [Helicoverpa zea]|uniref:uncharacterized protein LOC124643051 n=1 Tax=Helicoverpa zea TaxID=7113 RepID=UPI001F5659F2|nr:uncharacterized protein LOC124643051 [Helicoverpa zea]
MRRSMGRRGNMNNTGGGPLMTEHLQDIDLELELLKRKREMIEQQQHLLAMEQQFNSSRQSYDPMRYDEPAQHGSNRDFTHLYDSGPKYRNQYGKKRQPEFAWQYDGSPKRTTPSAKKKNPQPPFNQHHQRSFSGSGQGSKYPSKGPTPLMDIKVKQSIGQRIANQKPPPKAPRKDFPQGKVSKPKAPPAPNKLASHDVAKRKALVSAATAAASDADVSRMLLPDRVPTQQVSGRLELALGAIMKNIRALIDKNPEYGSVLRWVQLQRVMKQAVRERIRTVMLGKVVGSLNEILAVYREEFPEETDIDIVNIALEAGGVAHEEPDNNIKFIESAEPENFYKLNMTCAIESKLFEMFNKLEEMYGQPQKHTLGKVEGTSGKAEETPGKAEETPGKAEDSPGKAEETPGKSEETPGKAEEAPGKAEETTGKAEDITPTIDLPKEAEKNAEAKDGPEEHKKFMNTEIKVFEIKRILPRIMKRYIPYIVKLLNVDAMYQTTKAAITMKACQKASAIFVKQLPEEVQSDVKATAQAQEAPTEERQNMYNLPYYVKIMGRPTLPKRKVMQTFLNQFNPKSIKKHRTIHNLLFVGFSEKSDFDIMVGADGTMIGRCKLSVRICSKGPNAGQNGENADENASKDESQTEAKNGDQNGSKTDDQNESKSGDKSSDIISSDLDFQITDLLSSIRKSEEEDKTKDSDNSSAEVQLAAEQGKNDTDKAITDKEGDIAKDNQENTDKIENKDTASEKDGTKDGNTAEKTGDVNAISQENGDSEMAEPANDLQAENTEIKKEPTDTENTNGSDTVMSEVNDNAKSENGDGTDIKTETSDDSKNAGNNAQTEPPETKTAEEEKTDKVAELKSNTSGRSTPSRTSARLANVTPSTIRTRRASRLANN